jgi:ribosome-associated protein
MNQQRAMARLEEKLAARLRKRRPRIKTRPGKAAIARRLDAKRKQGDKKRDRKRLDL